MSPLRLILASLRYHWRMNLAVAGGVAVGAAVLTGALLVGDSMRESLRHLTLDRFGRIDAVIMAERFFRAALAEELAAEPEFGQQYDEAVPVILLRTSVQWRSEADRVARANHVELIGCDHRFWQLGSGGPAQAPGPREIVLNQPAAEQLGVEVGGKLSVVKAGDRVILRLARPGAIPADSPLGRKTETLEGLALAVREIIPAEGLGAFALQPSQRLPRNAYVALDWLAAQLDQPGRANAILVAGKATAGPPQDAGLLPRLLRPRAEDAGIHVQRTSQGYLNVTTDRLLFAPAMERAIVEGMAAGQIQSSLTYLANTIACGSRELPYSTITAVDFVAQPPLGPFLDPDGKPVPPLRDVQIALNSWAAKQLQAKPGDRIQIRYFEPESAHGRAQEAPPVEFELAAVVELAGAASDRAFTPKVPGVTDQLTMVDWDPPFPFDARRIRAQDEQYWDQYGPTPKAFVSLSAGRRLWGSRFGQTTALRLVPSQTTTVQTLEAKLAQDPAALGFSFQAVKRQGLQAAAGTTPFHVLFLAFSGFIIAAAAMLVALLFRLGVQQRAGQLGLLAAVGFHRRQVGRLLAGEGLVVAALGSVAGVPLGIGYAALMLLGLRTWWLAAVVTPFLRLSMTPTSLAMGFGSGVLVAVLAILWSVHRTARLAPRQLLAGQTAAIGSLVAYRPRYAGWLSGAMFLAAAAMGLAAEAVGEDYQAGVFFGAGALVLCGALVMSWSRLRSGATRLAVGVGRGNLGRMALRNAARNPGRSTLTIGLLASTCFLIVAVSAFRLDPTGQAPRRDNGTGGFAVVAESDQPVYQDLNTPEARRELGFAEAGSKALDGFRAMALRVKPGDDASCLNLYRPGQPRVLGLPGSFIARGGFAFAASAATTPEQTTNPWRSLQEDLGADRDGTPLLPVVIDKNTAMYSLHLWKGVGETLEITDGQGRPVRLKVVGLLQGSIFQGDLLMGESAFLRCFPEVSGYRFFLLEGVPDATQVTPGQTKALQSSLESVLGDYGLSTETTTQRLAGFLAVQNTYLSTFQSLGGLGLLLGTLGLAAVQLRNVLERRGELALLSAIGFRRSALAAMVMLENALLLLGGLLSGLLAALVAVLPHLLHRTATIPWASLAGTLTLVLVVGSIAGLVAVRAMIRAPLLAALREER